MFGLPFLKFNNSKKTKKTLQAYMEDKVVYMMVQQCLQPFSLTVAHWRLDLGSGII